MRSASGRAAEDRLRATAARSSGLGLLDEATSALDAASETLLYEQVAAAKIDVVSVNTRARLLRFHDVLLELLGNGEWRISRPDSSRLSAG
jgi:putative ATP-binding cassette transporter